jgi:DNA-binding transcriptional ArsR family regulator
MTETDLDAVFAALASTPRRRLLDLLKRSPGSTVGDLGAQFDGEMGRFGVMKHLRVLEAAGLVISEREGRSRRLWFNAVPMQLIHERWGSEFSDYWATKLTQLQYRAEGAHVVPIPQPKRKRTRG